MIVCCLSSAFDHRLLASKQPALKVVTLFLPWGKPLSHVPSRKNLPATYFFNFEDQATGLEGL